MLVCPKCGSTYTREQEHCGLDGAKLVRSDTDPMIGKVIDKYRIEERVGSGGMATVYRARHQFLDKDYAVKVLHGQIAADGTMARRFQREAKTLGQIKHPNVVSVDNFGSTPAGLLYMVMEYLDGSTLAQVLRAHGPMAPGRAADVVRQIATGLWAAHRKGFIHRDLKPGNVMLVNDEHHGEIVKLTDFGLVRIFSADERHTQLTQEGQFFGTPMYMAPEQISGHEVSPATDLYSLGVILYQMLSGKPPFLGDIKQLAFQHVQTEAPALGSPFGGLSALAQHLLAKNPPDRPSDAMAVVSKIDELALTPVSKPPSVRALSGGAPPRTEFDPALDFGPEDDPALSRPILLEERAFLSARGDADNLRESIEAALGRRTNPISVILLMLFLVAGAAGALYVYNGRSFDLDRLQQRISAREATNDTVAPAGASKPPPAPPQTEVQPKRRDAPAPAVRSKTEGEAERDDAPAPPPPAAPSETKGEPERNDAPAPPPPAAPPVAPPRSFIELEEALATALLRRGLTFEDLAEASPDPTDVWRQFREAGAAGDLPPRAELERVYSQLADAARSVAIDERLLGDKVARIDGDLRVLKAVGPPLRQAQLRARFDDLRREVDRKPRRRSIDALVTELSRVEKAIADAERDVPSDLQERRVPSPAPSPESGSSRTSTSTVGGDQRRTAPATETSTS